ncbi:uncharacterized protein LOC122987758 isoform X1 [Thunnus albacares]|uniref:uncharacterized protein LOC122987758 isoform X1 n=1 Tax=Thunnus albacares TaxID=8236 RepID=UPI001CF63567|nr:uncharacterized protein LOC122987758 isoform X1 [Thunnus albacares]
MTVTVVKDKKVTVVTVAADSRSMWPTLCQILKILCYRRRCCSVYKARLQTSVTAALGTIQIMVGLFSTGLGPGRISTGPEDFASRGGVYWLSGVFIAVGIMTILAGQYPNLCLMGFTVFMNIIGLIFAIVHIVLYGRDLANSSVLNLCDRSWYNAGNDNDACRRVAFYAQDLLTGIDITSIVLGVLQLCVNISFVVLGIKALVNRKKEEQGDEDVEVLQPEFKEVLMTSPGA